MPATADTINYYFAVNGYMVIETDEDSTATYAYYLFVNKFGSWYLMRAMAISSTQKEYTFSKGSLPVGTNWLTSSVWVLRSSPTPAYAYPDVMFKDL